MLWIRNKSDKERFQKYFLSRIVKIERRRKKKKNNKKTEQNERDRIRELYRKGKLLETTYDDDMINQGGYLYLTSVEQEDYFSRKEVRDKILDLQLEHMHQTQHVGPSPEVLKAIEDAAWAEFYVAVAKKQQQQQQRE